ncbi:MAG: hypothetical protein IJF73_06450 [Clostridia bacterium]|nr:hypothetical protein [Clostridia bacterium]
MRKSDLNRLKFSLGISQKVQCSEEKTEEYRKLISEGQALPDGVFCENANDTPEYACFYTVQDAPLTKEELAEYLQYKQLRSIITIKNCVVYFTVISIISLCIALISLIMS